MPYITATEPTLVKLSEEMGLRLPADQKAPMRKGQRLAVVSCESNGNHSKVTFSGTLVIGGKPIKSAWIYTPSDPKLRHWDGLEIFRQAAIATDNYYSPKGSSDFIIPVPYQSQIGNSEALFGPDWRQCMMTAVSEAIRVVIGEAAVANALAKTGHVEWESVYGDILNQYGDTTEPDAHVRALASMGIKAIMRYDGTPEILRALLRKGVPVPAGFKWSTDGHYRCIVGFGDDGSFIIDDPYGKYNPAINDYDKIGPYGQHLRFSAEDMRYYWNDLGPNKGWLLEIQAKPFNESPPIASTSTDPWLSQAITEAVQAMANPKLPQAEIDQLIATCKEWLPKFGITTRNRLIHFFAQCGHESGGFWWLDEQGDYDYFEGEYGIAVRSDLGNKVVGDGAKYHGRGLGMVTGLYNYELVMAETGIDYVTYPDRMLEYPGALVGTLIWWRRNKMNELCDQGLDDADVNAVGGRLNGKNPPNNANDRLNRSDKLKLVIL